MTIDSAERARAWEMIADKDAEIARIKAKNLALYKKISELATDAYELTVRAEAAEERLGTRLTPDLDGIAKLVDGEAWIAIQDGRDALPDSMWHVRRDWALRKAQAILDLYAISPAVREGK